MRLYAKMLLSNKVDEPTIEEQHITNLAVARLNNLSYDEDFSEISVESQVGVIPTGYLYIYLDDTNVYIPFCYDVDGIAMLKITGTVGGSRYGVTIAPKNYEQGIYTFEGGIKEVATDKIVQTFTITYTKVD